MARGSDPVFEVLHSSPLLIRRVRGPGGAGGRRIHAGIADGELAVRVEGGGRTSITAYGSVVAAVHAYNAELLRARRDGLWSSPEPVELSEGALQLAADALRP